jgi:hypothetical protein
MAAKRRWELGKSQLRELAGALIMAVNEIGHGSRFGIAVVTRALFGILLLTAAPGSVAAQGRLAADYMRAPDRAPSGCVVAATLLGGAAGMFVGGAVGALLERALYRGNPDAGVTGLAVGMIAGAAGGIHLARKACAEPTANQLEVARHRSLLATHFGDEPAERLHAARPRHAVPGRPDDSVPPCDSVRRPVEAEAGSLQGWMFRSGRRSSCEWLVAEICWHPSDVTQQARDMPDGGGPNDSRQPNREND